MKDDWRLTNQETWLKGAVPVRSAYTQPSAAWDHDHCEFCWATFSERAGDLREGYCTPDRYRWICSGCFDDFKERFCFTVASAPT